VKQGRCPWRLDGGGLAVSGHVGDEVVGERLGERHREWGNPDWRSWGLIEMAVHGGESWQWGNNGEEVGHKVIHGVQVVKEVHDTGWDLMEMAAALKVGRR
jgi:hypothetical protein